MFVMCVRASLTSGRTGEHEASNLQVIRVATEYTFQLSPSSHLVKTMFKNLSDSCHSGPLAFIRADHTPLLPPQAAASKGADDDERQCHASAVRTDG